MTEIRGITTFHSETGTEGGYWAVQDAEHMTKVAPTYGIWGPVFDAKDPERAGKVLSTWGADGRTFPDPIQYDPDYSASSLFRGQDSGDREADERLQERWGFKMTYWEDRPGYVPGGTPKTEPRRPYGASEGEKLVSLVQWADAEDPVVCVPGDVLVERWSYEGLHVLADGDVLTVYLPDGEIKWEGEIRLIDRGLFKADYEGMWIHADQEGVERDEWGALFIPGQPCKLIPR